MMENRNNNLPKMRETTTTSLSSPLLLNSANSGAKKRKRGSGGPRQRVTNVTLDNGASVKTTLDGLGKRDSMTLSIVEAAERHKTFTFADHLTRLVSEIYQVCETTAHFLPGPYTLTIPLTAQLSSCYNINVVHHTSAVKATQALLQAKLQAEREAALAAAIANGQPESTPIEPVPENNNTGSSQRILPTPVGPIFSSDGWAVVTENVAVIENGKQVTISSQSPGLWMVICTLREEFFSLPQPGVLFSSKLSRFVSTRFPKGATRKERKYRHRIIPLSPEVLKTFQVNLMQLSDLVVLSDVYEFEEQPAPSNDNGRDLPGPEFHRPATIRLPLPELPNRLPEKECVWRVFSRPGPSTPSNGGWAPIEQVTKQITRTSLAFDTRHLESYIVAYTISNLNPFLGIAVSFIWQQSFILNNWSCAAVGRASDGMFWLAFNLVRDDKHREEWFAKKAAKGYKPLRATVVVKEEEDNDQANKVSLPGGRNRAPLMRRYSNNSFDNGADWCAISSSAITIAQMVKLTIDGEIKWFTDSAKQAGCYLIQAQPFVGEHDVEFRIEPDLVTDNVRSLYGNIKAYLISQDETTKKELPPHEMASFAVDLSRDQVKEWYDIMNPAPPPAPPQPVAPTSAVKEMDAFDRFLANNPITDTPAVKVARPTTTPAGPNVPRQMSSSFLRLTAPMAPSRRRLDITKEAKVLSGRSLNCLANELRDGLVLALNLGLPDSMVTGIGFDALSEGLSLVDVTYRILLLWKRRTTRAKDQVDQLIEAVVAFGRQDMAVMLKDHAQLNLELTPACVCEYITHRRGFGNNKEDGAGKRRSRPTSGDSSDLEDDDLPANNRRAATALPASGYPQTPVPPQSRHFASGVCQAKKMVAEAKMQKELLLASQLQSYPATPVEPASVPMLELGETEFVEYRRLSSQPKLIGVENGPTTTLQNTSNPYLSKLAPLLATQQSAEFLAINQPVLLKNSKNNIENAISQEEAPDRPSTPSSDVADDVSQISL